MYTRLGGAFILFGGLVSTMIQAILFKGSPLIGVAFADCVIGVIGIFAASFMSRKPGLLYLGVTVLRLVIAIALFTAFLVTFVPQDHLSHLLCKEISILEQELSSPVPQETIEAAQLACQHAGAIVMGLVATVFVLSITLCWYPCFRCSLYYVETLSEKEALEGLLHDVDEDEDDDVVMKLTSQSPAKEPYAEAASVVAPPLSVVTTEEL
jgi:hypothetical protein